MCNICFCAQNTAWYLLLSWVVVQSFSRVWLFVTLWTAARQASLSFTISRRCSNSCPLSQWCHPTISSSVVPFSSCPQSFPSSGPFQRSQFLASGGQTTGVASSVSVLPMNFQGWFPLGLTGLISCCPRDCQESSPAPQLESINSLVLSRLYGPIFTSVHDYRENHSSNYTDLCRKTDISAF